MGQSWVRKLTAARAGKALAQKLARRRSNESGFMRGDEEGRITPGGGKRTGKRRRWLEATRRLD
jgi:hypothetical protein